MVLRDVRRPEARLGWAACLLAALLVVAALWCPAIACAQGSVEVAASTLQQASDEDLIGSLALTLDADEAGSITYCVLTDEDGWSSWGSDGEEVGSADGSCAVKAVKVELTGAVSDSLEVWYRCYVVGYGWTGWARNGMPSGTMSFGGALSAVQVQVVERGASAPGDVVTAVITSAACANVVSVGASSASSSDEASQLVALAVDSDELVVHFIDVGQADCTFIEFPDGTCMLIDAGGADTADEVVSYIAALGYTTIDYVLATHPHADHIGGLAAVIEAFDIGEIWAPDATTDTATFEAFLDAALAKGLTITTASAGDVIVSGEAGFTVVVLGPEEGVTSDDLNDCSLVVRVDFGETSFLFTGDAPAESIPTDHVGVLKVSHHGSDTGTTDALAAAVSPTIAVISYGLGNSYGHPTQDVLDALAATGASVYGTGANGTVVIVSDGEGYEVSVERDGTVVAATDEDDVGDGDEADDAVSEEAAAEEAAAEEAASASTSDADAEADADADADEKIVYVTPTGSKYHRESCSTLSRSTTITAMTEEEALAAGYEACKVCEP